MPEPYREMVPCPVPRPKLRERAKALPFAPLAAVAVRGKYWANGSTLKVSFEDGSAYLRERAWGHMKAVFALTGLKCQLVGKGQGTIRISFTRGGSWSYIGTDARLVSRSKHTMQFGWLTESSSATELQRVVRHEVLHALGFGHEQSHPQVNIPWDKEAVYDYYARSQGWSRSKVDSNVFRRYSTGEVHYTVYDPHSIMHYPVRNFMIQRRHWNGSDPNGYYIPFNSDLSANDIKLLQAIYPPPAKPEPPKEPPMTERERLEHRLKEARFNKTLVGQKLSARKYDIAEKLETATGENKVRLEHRQKENELITRIVDRAISQRIRRLTKRIEDS